MQCFKVLVHGRLVWLEESSIASSGDQSRPRGFYAHRFVLSPEIKSAELIALRKVRENFDRQTGWIKDGLVAVELKAEEVMKTSIFRGLLPDNLGHSFYEDE